MVSPHYDDFAMPSRPATAHLFPEASPESAQLSKDLVHFLLQRLLRDPSRIAPTGSGGQRVCACGFAEVIEVHRNQEG